MTEFWAWVTVHWFLTFILTWAALSITGGVLNSFLKIFHRRPMHIRLTDAQFQAIRQDLAARLTAGAEPPREISVVETAQPAPQRPKGRSWYERLG